MTPEATIVLCGGPINYTSLPIVESLHAGLQRSPTVVRVILGETLNTYRADEDFAYVRQVEDSRRWCLVDDAGRIVAYREDQASHPALCNGYHLHRHDHLAAYERCTR